MKKLLAFNLILLTLTVTVTVLGAELLVRVFAPQLTYRFPQGLFVADADTAYRLTPGYTGSLETPEYRTRVNVTRESLRDDREYASKSPDELRIVMLGDSFVMGVGVELEETLVEQLEELLDERIGDRDVEIVNMGVAGYSTRLAGATLSAYGAALDPDLVVLGFFVGNDFAENAAPPLGVRDGYLSNGKRHDESLLPYGVRRFFMLHSQLYHFAWPIQRRLRGHGAAEARKSARQIASVFVADDDTAAEIVNPTLEALDALIRECRSRDLQLAVVIIPDHTQVVPGAFDSLVAQAEMPAGHYSIDAPNRRITAFLDAHGIARLDLLPTFQARKDPARLYLPLDKHWTAPGHDVATEVAAGFVGDLIDSRVRVARAAR